MYQDPNVFLFMKLPDIPILRDFCISINISNQLYVVIIKMVARKTTRRRQPEPMPESSNKNLLGLGGIIMLILTNYQEEIKQVISTLLGSAK
jgi:hypothetical protein